MQSFKDFVELTEETMWDLQVKRGGKWSKANKKPMTKKELEKMMDQFKKSGIDVEDMKSDIVKESVELTEDLKLSPRCKKVIDAFANHRPDACKKLLSDGNTLDGLWVGGNRIAFWEGDKIHLRQLASRSQQTVARAVRKIASSFDMAVESVDDPGDGSALEEKGQRTFDVTISLGGQTGENVQVKGDPSNPAQFAAEIKKVVKSKTGKSKFKIQKVTGLEPGVLDKLRKMTESFQAEYLSEKKPGKGTLYVTNSSIFDNPAMKYDHDLFAQTLKQAGAKKTWTDNAFGWSNQPEVVLFTGLSVDKASKALDALPVFKKWGAMIGNAASDWD